MQFVEAFQAWVNGDNYAGYQKYRRDAIRDGTSPRFGSLQEIEALQTTTLLDYSRTGNPMQRQSPTVGRLNNQVSILFTHDPQVWKGTSSRWWTSCKWESSQVFWTKVRRCKRFVRLVMLAPIYSANVYIPSEESCDNTHCWILHACILKRETMNLPEMWTESCLFWGQI